MIVKKKINMNPNKIIVAVLVCALVMLSGLSYAWYQVTLMGEKELTLTSGSLSLTFGDVHSEVIQLENAEPMSDEDGLETIAYRFSLTNNGTIDSDFTLYLDDVDLTSGARIDDQYLKYSLVRDNQDATVEVLSSNEKFLANNGVMSRKIGMGTIPAGEISQYTLRIWLADIADNSVMNQSFKAKLRVEAMQKTQISESNIVKAYTYDERVDEASVCVTGEEAGCSLTTCYQDRTAGSCPVGTIIDYKVNNDNTVRFHVLEDLGNTMLMQSQKNVYYSTGWYTGADNTKGPMAALSVLEGETSTWNNVNDQTYTMGVTLFKNNLYTGCSSSSSCTSNTYTLPTKTVKSRLITLQEVSALGCTETPRSCPIWLGNYLGVSDQYGGTVNDKGPTDIARPQAGNPSYWLMNAYLSNTTHSWTLNALRNVSSSISSHDTYGVRAVVEISK